MVELVSGFPLFVQQYRALLIKNVILTWRNKRQAFLQIFSSFIFLLLMFSLEKIGKITHSDGEFADPPALVFPEIPDCEKTFILKTSCYDFVWSGNDSLRIEKIVSAILRNNPGRPISDDRVKSFRTPEEVDTWLLSNPMCCPGALHFMEKNSTVISYGLQTNSSTNLRKGETRDSTFRILLPLQVAAEREIARSLLGDPNFSWTVGLKAFAHPPPKIPPLLHLFGPALLVVISMFGFVFQICSLASEKELKLRQAMSIMGLYESAYWLSWLTWEGLLALLAALSTVLFGKMFKFDMFLYNNFTLIFLVFLLFQISMVGFAFMISIFLNTSSSASTVGYMFFTISGGLAVVGDVVVYMMDDFCNKFIRWLWNLFPPNLLYRALYTFAQRSMPGTGDGFRWRDRRECPTGSTCLITMEGILIWLVASFFLWFFLAIYLDNVIPNSNGVRKSVYYFLTPSYWTGAGGDQVEDGGLFTRKGSIQPTDNATPDDPDVLAEETTVKRQASENEIDPDVAVQIRGLTKTYPGTKKGGIGPRSNPYHAVKGLWVNLAKNQLFCLLGPNGAGKTTAISCLTGTTPVTGGDALIYGHSIRNSVGMSNIRKIIGVCPQFDVLWDALSGREHLRLFSSLKGLPPSTIESEAEKSLAEVKLTSAAQVRSGSYSGGMKRRLSVAIALIGNPQLIFLDEPTTGMDPISRRHVWDIIEEAKKGRAIILTTHSMEEADILSDRIAIMAKGKLRCMGTSVRLKSRFGTGYITTVSFHGNTPQQTSDSSAGDADTSERQAEIVKHLFKYKLNLEPKEENNKFLNFIIPHEKEALLTDFFTDLEDRAKELGISDIQLGLTTLEEVFLNIANQAEVESSSAEGNLVTLTLPSGNSIQIPVGARFVGIPRSESDEYPRGRMVEVYWENDDSGGLTVSDCSDETPIPENVRVVTSPVSPAATSPGSPPIGLVIDPAAAVNRQNQL